MARKKPEASAASAKKAATKSTPPKDSTANIGFEAKLWLTADKLRKHPRAS